MTTNNVTRLLQSNQVEFQAFELPMEKLGAQETANLLGVPVHLVYKTIVVEREKSGKPMLAVIPGDHEVDLRALAKAAGEKKVHVPTEREAERLTGLRAGGISPLALINRGFQVWVDTAIEAETSVHISGGQRGLNIRLPAADLVRLTQARPAVISHPLGQDRPASP
jgi:Cys-tRNA(Pro)/Cys-tRNA(Cys) deacylase